MRARILKYRRGELRKTEDRAYSCGGGKGKIAIFPDGRVTPCDHLPDLTLGDITRQSLEDILTGKEMENFTEFMNQKRSDYPECSDCKYLEFCTGGCPVEPLNMKEEIGIDRHSCLKRALGEE
jgi:radical SAM protein with 4Fe4S-binding SPASM domain